MSRALVGMGAALLAAGTLAALAHAQSVLQPEDRGGPGYTTGSTMGRDGAPSGASTDLGTTGSRAGEVPGGNSDAALGRGEPGVNDSTAGLPGLHSRAPGTSDEGAGNAAGTGASQGGQGTGRDAGTGAGTAPGSEPTGR